MLPLPSLRLTLFPVNEERKRTHQMIVAHKREMTKNLKNQTEHIDSQSQIGTIQSKQGARHEKEHVDEQKHNHYK